MATEVPSDRVWRLNSRTGNYIDARKIQSALMAQHRNKVRSSKTSASCFVATTATGQPDDHNAATRFGAWCSLGNSHRHPELAAMAASISRCSSPLRAFLAPEVYGRMQDSGPSQHSETLLSRRLSSKSRIDDVSPLP